MGHRHIKVNLSVFRQGDIVELQIAFMVNPSTTRTNTSNKALDKQFRLKLVIRSICQEDASETDVS